MKQKLYKVSTYGKKLNGKFGCTGVIYPLTPEQVEVYKKNVEKHGESCTIEPIKTATDDGAQQAEANARLIAAAPDMLEALEIAIEQGEFQPKVRDILVNTINKAKGVI